MYTYGVDVCVEKAVLGEVYDLITAKMVVGVRGTPDCDFWEIETGLLRELELVLARFGRFWEESMSHIPNFVSNFENCPIFWDKNPKIVQLFAQFLGSCPTFSPKLSKFSAILQQNRAIIHF